MVQGIAELYEKYKAKDILSHNSKVQEQLWGDKEFDAVDIHNNLLVFFKKYSGNFVVLK
ncbi:MAG: hypothetical protein WKF91_07330 [Segetibacter sp.]